MYCIMPGFPVHHQLLELIQIHVHWVSDAIQPSHPLSFPSPPTFNLSHHQGHFQWVSSLHQVPNYCSFSFSISPSNEDSVLISLGWTCWISLQPKGLSRVFSNTIVQKHQFFSAQAFCWLIKDVFLHSERVWIRCWKEDVSVFQMRKVICWFTEHASKGILKCVRIKSLGTWDPGQWTNSVLTYFGDSLWGLVLFRNILVSWYVQCIT